LNDLNGFIDKRPQSHLRAESLTNSEILAQLHRLAGSRNKLRFGTDEDNLYAGELAEELHNFRGAEGRALYEENAPALTQIAAENANAWFLMRIFQQNPDAEYNFPAFMAQNNIIHNPKYAREMENYGTRHVLERENFCPMPPENLPPYERLDAVRSALLAEIVQTGDMNCGRIAQITHRFLRMSEQLGQKTEATREIEAMCHDMAKLERHTALCVLSNALAQPGQFYGPEEAWKTLYINVVESDQTLQEFYDNLTPTQKDDLQLDVLKEKLNEGRISTRKGMDANEGINLDDLKEIKSDTSFADLEMLRRAMNKLNNKGGKTGPG
jgi:hypothetical protein